LFLNNDTKIITPDWLEAMVEQAQRAKIGAVGVMLLYPDQTIQHAGVILGVTGIAGHSHRHYQQGEEGYCQCSRDRFEEIDGFNEQLAIAYNDVDFCLKLHQLGYQNLWLPHVQLYHYESQTRTPENTPAKQRRIQQEVDYMKTNWDHLITRDPFYNNNLTTAKENCSLNVVHRFKIDSILLTPINQKQLTGYFIDCPQVGDKSSKHIEIVGWVISKLAKAVAIKISCQGRLLSKIPVCQKRPDVAEAFSQIKTAIDSGFATTIDLSQIEIDDFLSISLIPSLEPVLLKLDLTVVLANDLQILIAIIQLTC